MQAVLTKRMFVSFHFRKLELGQVDHERDQQPTRSYNNNNLV